jgi:hypothetical protein
MIQQRLGFQKSENSDIIPLLYFIQKFIKENRKSRVKTPMLITKQQQRARNVQMSQKYKSANSHPAIAWSAMCFKAAIPITRGRVETTFRLYDYVLRLRELALHTCMLFLRSIFYELHARMGRRTHVILNAASARKRSRTHGAPVSELDLYRKLCPSADFNYTRMKMRVRSRRRETRAGKARAKT